MPKAIRHMVIHQTTGLHVGVNNGATYEFESDLRDRFGTDWYGNQ